MLQSVSNYLCAKSVETVKTSINLKCLQCSKLIICGKKCPLHFFCLSISRVASWPTSGVACSKMEIRKHPHCVDFTVELPPIPHIVVWLESPKDNPLHTTTHIFWVPLANIVSKHGLLLQKHPIFKVGGKYTPHSTHILYYFSLHTHITQILTNFTPILCPHNPTQFFKFWPPFHTNSFQACYSNFWLSRSPGVIIDTLRASISLSVWEEH